MQLLLFKISSQMVGLSSKGLMGERNWGEDTPAWITNILEPILKLLDSLLLPIIIIIGTVGSIYAIILGVNYARAETTDKREEAKKRMINAVVGLVAMVFLLILLQLFVNNAETILEAIGNFGGDTPTGD